MIARTIQHPLSLLALAALLLATHPLVARAQTEWRTLSPQTTTQNIAAISFPDASTGRAVTERGTFLATDDGGQTWSSADLGVDGDAFDTGFDIHFVDANTGWIVGPSGLLLATTDGGATWTDQEGSTSQNLYAVEFVDASTGWIVGEEATVLRTTDGGATWEEAIEFAQEAAINFADLQALHVYDDSTALVGGQSGTMIATDSAGASWTIQATGTNQSLEALQFVDASTGWAVGGSATILTTTDGGETWTAQTSCEDVSLNDLDVVDATQAFVAGNDGIVCATTDGGATWSSQATGVDEFTNLNAVDFVDATTGWVAGDAQGEGAVVIRTTDGGTAWTMPSTSPVVPMLEGTHFETADTGWIVGGDRSGNSYVARTTDGGQSWTEQATNGDAIYLDVHFTSESTGWLIGEGVPTDDEVGVIYATDDGGENWILQESRILRTGRATGGNGFQAVHAMDDNTAWAVGFNVILATTDGGATWTQQSNGVGEDLVLHDVHFTDASNGTVVGYEFVQDKAAILTTSDGGATWSMQLIDMDRRLEAVHFSDASNGWAVGESGFLAVTSDGGATWTTKDHPAQETLQDVFFVDPLKGWSLNAFGSRTPDCEIWATANGGESWECEGNFYSDPFSIHFVDEETGYVVGREKTILKGQATPSLVTRETVELNDEGRLDFGATDVAIDFAAGSGFGEVTVTRYSNGPVGVDGIGESNVSSYRILISAESGVTPSTGTTVRFDASGFGGLPTPSDVTIYKRSPAGGGSFAALPTNYDSGTDEIYAEVTSFSEFVLASNTNDLPIELASFDATRTDNAARLTWTTAAETNNARFDIQRKKAFSAPTPNGKNDQWTKVGQVKGAGTTTEPRSYRFTDRDLPFTAEAVGYRLKQIDTDGTGSYSAPITVKLGTPTRLALRAPYPNPVRSRATLRYAVPDSRQDRRVTIRVYNVLGQEVATLVDEQQAAGRKELVLNTHRLSSGIYFVRMRVGDVTRTQRMIVVR